MSSKAYLHVNNRRKRTLPIKVVTPPAAAAFVAVSNPSHAVRPLR